jgi:hypothetical protein
MAENREAFKRTPESWATLGRGERFQPFPSLKLSHPNTRVEGKKEQLLW